MWKLLVCGVIKMQTLTFLSALFLIKFNMKNKIVQCSFTFSHWPFSFAFVEKMCRFFFLDFSFHSFLTHVLNSPTIRTKVKHKLWLSNTSSKRWHRNKFPSPWKTGCFLYMVPDLWGAAGEPVCWCSSPPHLLQLLSIWENPESCPQFTPLEALVLQWVHNPLLCSSDSLIAFWLCLKLWGKSLFLKIWITPIIYKIK